MSAARPLERIDRMARYLLQRDVTTHVRHGSSWQPTPRQRRRLDKKARHAAAPFGRDYIAEAYVASAFRSVAELDRANDAAWELAMTDTRGPAASAVIVDEVVTSLATGEQRAEPRSDRRVVIQQFAGFRVVDRRGEHRS